MNPKKPKAKKDDISVYLQQIEELTASLQRERADAMNVRRRAEEEKIKLGSFYKALVVRELLPVIDNFDRAMSALPDELKDNEYMKGVAGIAKQLSTALEKLGVERIGTLGEMFDPAIHDAISSEEGDGENEVVSEVLQYGYRLQDEIIRPAMVKVRQ